jgi:hypothetical protein
MVRAYEPARFRLPAGQLNRQLVMLINGGG